MRMVLDDRTPQEGLTRETRRAMLCAFADRMLVKVTAMDDPEDMPGVERAVRVAAVIERIYSRCDRAEAEGPNRKKLEAENAQHTAEAIRTRVALAGTMEWGEQRRQKLGKWWDAAAPAALAQAEAPVPVMTPVQPVAPAPVVTQPAQQAVAAPESPRVDYVDCTDAILKARAEIGLNDPGEPTVIDGSETPEQSGDSGPRIRSFDNKWPPP